ncbi:MAG: SpoIID/LytB domain-containing protein [Bacteroidales bacterium]|nr:SpoIID/LytB domain-containing protein [Bacteroidales bacterium]
MRLLSDSSPESVIFTVDEGNYEIRFFDGESISLERHEPVVITRYNGRIAVRTRSMTGSLCDSVIFKGVTGRDIFSLRLTGQNPVRRLYSGDLFCSSDLGTIMLINTCDVEDYIAGVVRTESGAGRNIEYTKTQALLVRTYMYKYMYRHTMDGYNLCDLTHCQAFNGITDDPVILRAARETKGLVILDSNKIPVISAFHSNCGGETAQPRDVWLSNHPYLTNVRDPYCTSSRSASWHRTIPLSEWIDNLRKHGLKADLSDPSVLNFSQLTRMSDYRVGNFTIPLRILRDDFKLRSTFFSVTADHSKVLLKGRGYGHGVGLCQEGAMVMASRGFNFRQIIEFYYTGVLITDIKNARDEHGRPFPLIEK